MLGIEDIHSLVKESELNWCSCGKTLAISERNELYWTLSRHLLGTEHLNTEYTH